MKLIKMTANNKEIEVDSGIANEKWNKVINDIKVRDIHCSRYCEDCSYKGNCNRLANVIYNSVEHYKGKLLVDNL